MLFILMLVLGIHLLWSIAWLTYGFTSSHGDVFLASLVAAFPELVLIGYISSLFNK